MYCVKAVLLLLGVLSELWLLLCLLFVLRQEHKSEKNISVIKIHKTSTLPLKEGSESKI